MSKQYFMSNELQMVIDYLTRNNIVHEVTNKHIVIIPAYLASGQNVSLQIYFDPLSSVLVFQAQAEQPVQDDEIDMMYAYLNACNAQNIIGRFYLCPHCFRLTYGIHLFMTGQTLMDAEISAYLDLTAETFMDTSIDIDKIRNTDPTLLKSSDDGSATNEEQS